jgi:hypothetical protein
MKFDELYDKLILELNQSTMHSALQKHERIRGKNPVAATRAGEFAHKITNRMRDRGMMIEVTSNPKSKMVSNQMYVSLESAEFHGDDQPIMIHGLSLSDPDEQESSTKIMMTFDVENGELSQYFDGSYTEKLWLQTRTHAENLAKFIRREVGIPVSWKSMDFLSGIDNLSQHNDTRYGYDKIKSHTQ